MRKAACCPDLTDPLLSREPNNLLPHPSFLHLRNQECSIPAATRVASCLQDALKTNCCNRPLSPLYSPDHYSLDVFMLPSPDVFFLLLIIAVQMMSAAEV